MNRTNRNKTRKPAQVGRAVKAILAAAVGALVYCGAVVVLSPAFGGDERTLFAAMIPAAVVALRLAGKNEKRRANK